MRPMSLFPWLLPLAPRTKVEIAEDVARRHGLTRDALSERTRKREVLRPRQKAMAEMFATGRYNLADIGRFFGVHRTTVKHAVEVSEGRDAVAATP